MAEWLERWTLVPATAASNPRGSEFFLFFKFFWVCCFFILFKICSHVLKNWVVLFKERGGLVCFGVIFIVFLPAGRFFLGYGGGALGF